MTKEMYKTITDWQDVKFPSATPLSCVNHLEEEVDELKEKIEQNIHDPNEIADCFLLLISVCNKSGMTYDDVVEAIRAKMEINWSRKWGKPNEKGYVKHIKE